jgi:hypothetical protein
MFVPRAFSKIASIRERGWQLSSRQSMQLDRISRNRHDSPRVRRLFHTFLALTVALATMWPATAHVHAYADHTHPDHEHGPAVHGHHAAGHHHASSATRGHAQRARLESCDPGAHTVFLTLAGKGTQTSARESAGFVTTGIFTLRADRASRPSAAPLDERQHGPPARGRVPARAPPLPA